MPFCDPHRCRYPGGRKQLGLLPCAASHIWANGAVPAAVMNAMLEALVGKNVVDGISKKPELTETALGSRQRQIIAGLYEIWNKFRPDFDLMVKYQVRDCGLEWTASIKKISRRDRLSFSVSA